MGGRFQRIDCYKRGAYIHQSAFHHVSTPNQHSIMSLSSVKTDSYEVSSESDTGSAVGPSYPQQSQHMPMLYTTEDESADELNVDNTSETVSTLFTFITRSSSRQLYSWFVV